ncbi:MIB1 [Branchiostoma lanceolatum]|uniref:MIB1 protein n=1 Tax=Branchiostoma lanceolatum TaxID=7740 RepID=A0A8S4MNR1_BRALA|nr:MIB1 [Branchiostoma lanceolatum]
MKKREVQVKFPFKSEEWWYNPKALTKITTDEQETIHQLKAGDCVRVAVDAETFQANQVGHGGRWNKMEELISMKTAGIIRHFDLDGDAFINYQNGDRHIINPASLEKVNPEDYKGEDTTELKKGEWVKIDPDKARIKQVQTANVGWDDGTYAVSFVWFKLP